MSWLKILGYKAFLWVLGSNFSNSVILGLRWFMFLEKIKDFFGQLLIFALKLHLKVGLRLPEKSVLFPSLTLAKLKRG